MPVLTLRSGYIKLERPRCQGCGAAFASAFGRAASPATDSGKARCGGHRGGRRQGIDPRIKHGRAGLLIIADIAGHDRQPVMECRRGNDEIRLREGMARLAAVLDQQPPLEHDVLGDCEDTPLACIRFDRPLGLWRVGPLRVAAWAAWDRAARSAPS